MAKRFTSLPLVTLLMSAAAIAIWWAQSTTSHLQYDRSALAAGEWWRIFTCHWTHFSADHLAWDVGAFALLGAICEARSRARFMTCVGLAAALIPAAIWILLPQMQIYRGLSGIGSAVFVLLAVDLLRSQHQIGARGEIRTGAVVVLALFIAKIVVETLSGRTVFVKSTTEMTPVPIAHLVGAAVGGLCSVAMSRYSRPFPQVEVPRASDPVSCGSINPWVDASPPPPTPGAPAPKSDGSNSRTRQSRVHMA
jgi:rhomboid family GlyGly-CTERM serine protease